MKKQTIIEAITEMGADGYTAAEIVPHMGAEERNEYLNSVTCDEAVTEGVLKEVFNLL